jgi:outer membrane protein assembly factor BamD
MMDRSFSSSRPARFAVGVMAAALALTAAAGAQVTGSSQTTTDAQGRPQESATISVNTSKKKTRESKKDEKVKSTKDTRAEEKKEKKMNPLIGKDADLPDKQLYDKALAQIKSGHFDVARLDLNTLLSTYPDSQYQMRAKLAIADAWYREGGSAALAQAEQEYKDFITFFPNAPEAAEAQMRVGDIYFKQMDVPDRDYSKAQHAEEEYRTMLKQYPDAPKDILKQAQQKLRDVQEVLAQREADVGAFYASHEDWPAALARYQTVVETYPQYSHMDDVLIGIGDAYEAEAGVARAAKLCAPNLPQGTPCMNEALKSSIEQQYDGKAAAEYREVVLKHAAAPHAEFAKERLAAMNLPIPQPTADDMAASEALEGSRAQYTMQKRLELLFMRKPDTVTAAQIGDPPLDDPSPVLAPEVAHAILDSYKNALNPGASSKADVKVATPAIEPGPGEVPPEPRTPPGQPASNAPAAPPALSDVPAAGSGNDTGSVTEMTPASPSGASPSGTGVGVEVLTPGVNTGAGAASSLPSATGSADPNAGLKAVGSKDAPLPAVEAPAVAPDQVNDAAGQQTPPGQAKPAGKKNPKPDYDKNDESSSKHKKKKGVDKLNPF